MSLLFIIGSFIIIGNLMIPSESAVYQKKGEIKHNALITRIIKHPKSGHEKCTNFLNNCLWNKKPDEEKSDVTIFQEEFCFRGEFITCLKQLDQQCAMNDTVKEHYQTISKKFDEISHDMLKMELCTNGPYNPDYFEYVSCLRFVRDPIRYKCAPLIKDIQKEEIHKTRNHHSILMEQNEYIYCEFQIIREMCGTNAEAFAKEYFDAAIKSFSKSL